eukprot:1191506-Amphidinium_carterae.1
MKRQGAILPDEVCYCRTNSNDYITVPICFPNECPQTLQLQVAKSCLVNCYCNNYCEDCNVSNRM